MLRIPPTDHTLSLENHSSSDEGDCHDTTTGTATDLEVEVRRLRNETLSQQKQITVLQNHKGSQQKQITDQQQQITALQKQITAPQKHKGSQQRQINKLKNQIKQILSKFKAFEQNAVNTHT